MNCDTCRFWSERLAYANGGEPVKAMCISKDSPRKSTYTTGRQGCPNWKSGEYGAVDSPGEEAELAAMYAELDASS